MKSRHKALRKIARRAQCSPDAPGEHFVYDAVEPSNRRFVGGELPVMLVDEFQKPLQLALRYSKLGLHLPESGVVGF